MNYKDPEEWKVFDQNVNILQINKYIKFISNIEKEGDRNLRYYEEHHIIPRCLLRNSKINDNILIKLTFREHYIAHKILTKCFTNQFKHRLLHAFQRVAYSKTKGYVRSKDYEYLRNQYRETPTPKEIKEKISKGRVGKTWSEERKSEFSKKIKELRKDPTKWTNKGYYFTEKRRKQAIANLENINKIQKGKNHPMYGRKHTKESRELISKNHYDCNGKNNGRYNLKLHWISNLSTKETKMIKPELLDEYLEQGWIKGRKFKIKRSERK